jgi:hypothetical protein
MNLFLVSLTNGQGYYAQAGNKVAQSVTNERYDYGCWINKRHQAVLNEIRTLAASNVFGAFAIRPLQGQAYRFEVAFFYPKNVPDAALPTQQRWAYPRAWSRTDWVPLEPEPSVENYAILLVREENPSNPFLRHTARAELGRLPETRLFVNEASIHQVSSVVNLLSRRGPSYEEYTGVYDRRGRRPSSSWEEADGPWVKTSDGTVYELLDDGKTRSKARSASRWGIICNLTVYVKPTLATRLKDNNGSLARPSRIMLREQYGLEVCRAYARSKRPDYDLESDWVANPWTDASMEPEIGLCPVQLWNPMLELCTRDSYDAYTADIGTKIVSMSSD